MAIDMSGNGSSHPLSTSPAVARPRSAAVRAVGMWYEPLVSSADPAFVVETTTWDDFCGLLSSPPRRAELGGPDGGAVVVRDGPDSAVPAAMVEAARQLPVIVVLDASIDEAPASSAIADVIASGADLEAIVERATAHPQAATALALLLRASGTSYVFDGLVAESAVYSTLQSGTEFRSWRADHPVRSRPVPDAPAVLTSRSGDVLDVVLNRPEVRNALDARMRDELWEAFLVAASDPTLTVRWSGAGPSFCSGGDLDEFGSLPDPASGHLIRLTRSIGLAVHRITDRVTVHVHGSCAGSGVELPAFAGTVVAAPDARFSLPELQLGLVPGAGGTVSLPRRIGRHRTAWLALTGEVIDADRAASWGLVDRIDADPPSE